MQRNRLGQLALASAALLTASLAAGAGAPAVAATESDIPSFSEFQSQTYRDVDQQFIVNGDEPVQTSGDLKSFYDKLVAPATTPTEGLVVNTVGGVDDKWSDAQVRNLTYCVSTKFGSRYTDVVNAMTSGADLWEAASAADFIHVPSQDASCNTRNKTVLFSVEPVSTTQYIARAFFPSTPKRSRNVLIDDSIWTSGSWTPTNIIGHELGHTLGFRHEHTRPESGTCFEDNNWRPLTPYDSASIMHYPQCNGSSDDLSMTASDRQGAAALYGS